MRKHTCHLDLRQRSLPRHDWTKELVSKIDRQPQEEVARQPREEVARQPRGEVSRQAKFFQPTQPIPKPICDRSGQPDNKHDVFVDKGETSWSRESKEKSSHEELCSSDRSGQPDITPSVIRAQINMSGEIRDEQTHDRSGQPDKHEFALRAAPEIHREIMTLNTDNELTRERIEEDMDFKIPGLPHSTVKQLQSASVRELIQKIENHPHRNALQRDLQQSQSFNPFQSRIKTNDSGCWEHRIVRITRHGTQNAVQSMFIILGHRHRLLHVRALLAERYRGE